MMWPPLDSDPMPIRMERNRKTREWQVEAEKKHGPLPPAKPLGSNSAAGAALRRRRGLERTARRSQQPCRPLHETVAVLSPTYGAFRIKKADVVSFASLVNSTSGSMRSTRIKVIETLPDINNKGTSVVRAQQDNMAKEVEKFERDLAALNQKTKAERSPQPQRLTVLAKLKETYAGNLLRSTSMPDIYKTYVELFGNTSRNMQQMDMRELFHQLVPHYPIGDDQLYNIFSIFDENRNGEVSFKELFGALGGILYGEGTFSGVRYFYDKIEGLGQLGHHRNQIPVTRLTARHIEIIVREHIPGNIAHIWLKLAETLETTLARDPIDSNYIDFDQFLCYVYLHQPLATCFNKIVPKTQSRLKQHDTAEPSSARQESFSVRWQE